MPQWTALKVLVTGASGFLGFHLCRSLSQASAEVHGTSRAKRRHEKGGVIWWQVDMADLEAVRHLFTNVKPDIIFHLSGLVSANPNREFVLPTFHSLLTSTVNLLTVATEVGCRRIVFAGSLNEPQPDHTEIIPGSPYAAAKWAASGYGRMFHALYGTPLVIVRIFMTYGPGQDSRKVIPTVVLSLLKGEPPKLTSGHWKADWIYIDDVIAGLLRAAQVPQIEGMTLDLGTGTLVSVRELVNQLLTVVGSSTRPFFGAQPDRPLEPIRKADISFAFEKLGWRADIPLKTGLLRTVDWYRAHLHESSSIPPQDYLSGQ